MASIEADPSGESLASLLYRQVSSDQLIDSHDVENVHEIIIEGRMDEDEDEAIEGIYDSELVTRPNNEVTFNLWAIVYKGAINVVLPFINGMMLGFGEILAHEIGFKFGFAGARVVPPRRQHTRGKSEYI